MLAQIPASNLSPYSKLEFSLTKTKRNEQVDIRSLGSNFVLDLDGVIYQLSSASKSATIKVVGGISSFVNAKKPTAHVFYLTTQQKRTLRNIMNAVASNSDIEIKSDSEPLQEMLNGQYYNYRG